MLIEDLYRSRIATGRKENSSYIIYKIRYRHFRSYKHLLYMNYIIFILFLCFSLTSLAQKGDDCDNCIYDVQVRNRLTDLYQDKSDAYYNCKYTEAYQSKEWAGVSYIEIFSGRQDQLEQYLKAQTPLDSIVAWFPESTVVHNLLAIKYDYLDYKDNPRSEIVVYNGLDPKEFRIDQNESGWITGHTHRGPHNGVSGILLPTEWKSQKLSNRCNELINYVDCMIDSESMIYTYDRDEERPYISEPFKALFAFIEDRLPELDLENQKGYSNDEYDKEMAERNHKKIEALYQLKDKTTRDLAQSSEAFKKLYEEAKIESERDQVSTEEFEEIVEIMDGPVRALQLKRNRQVMGSCSMDNSPIDHLKEIARLSAHTAEWNVFLRSHMNIINDRFSAVAMSSYGEKSRNTPIHDLEAIGLEPDKLFVGSLLRARDTKSNHYYSSFHRISRAISQLTDPNPSIHLLKEIVKDRNNDIPNR